MSEEKKPKQPKRTGRTVLTIFLVLAVAAGGIYLYNYRQQQQDAATLASLTTVAYTRETLITTINGTGTVRPNRETVLVWEISGTVSPSEVQLEDTVKEGQVLLALDQENPSMEVLQAQLDKNNIETSLASLEENTASQRAKLNADIASARTSLTSLERELQLLEERQCVDWRVENLRQAYENALQDYRDWPTETNWAMVQAARTDLDFCDPEVIDQQKSELASSIALQQQTIADAEDQLAKIKDGPDPDQKEQLDIQLEIVNKRLDSLELEAPFDGTLTEIFTEPGDQVAAGMQALRLSDLSHLYVDVPVSEVDIPFVKVGQTVDLVFDAYFEQTFSGHVTSVSPLGEARTGVVNFNVTVELDDGFDQIKPGMTAGVSIQVEQKENVFAVPSEALATLNGKDVVYVLRNNVPEAVEVKIGGYSDSKVEILEATIDEGELIVLNPPTSILDLVPNQFGRPASR